MVLLQLHCGAMIPFLISRPELVASHTMILWMSKATGLMMDIVAKIIQQELMVMMEAMFIRLALVVIKLQDGINDPL